MPTDAARLTRLTTLAVAVALMARLAFAFGYWTGKPLTNDEQEYLQLGRNIAAGNGFTYGPAGSGQAEPQGFGRAPLYPLLVSIVARVTASAALIPAMKITQGVLGATAVWLLALVTRRAAGARAGATAAWIAALYPPLVWLPAFMLSESLYVVLALANVLILGRVIDADALADRPDRRGALRWIAGAGILGGLAALTRPSHVFFLAVACLWLLVRRRLSWAAALAIAAALTIAPWTISNYVTYGRPVLIASEGGITFWTGNHPLSPGEGDMAANPAIKLDSLRVRTGHPGLTAEQLEPI